MKYLFVVNVCWWYPECRNLSKVQSQGTRLTMYGNLECCQTTAGRASGCTAAPESTRAGLQGS